MTYKGMIMDHKWKRTWEKATVACFSHTCLTKKTTQKQSHNSNKSYPESKLHVADTTVHWGRVKNMRRDTCTSLQASTKLTVSVSLQLHHVTEVTQVLAYMIHRHVYIFLSSAFLISLQYHVWYQQCHGSQKKPSDST